MKILVVDDSTWQRSMLKRALGSAGHTVIEASNGRQALERLSEAPEAIVSDLLMPELDGFALLGELKARGNVVPVVIASADVQQATRQRCTDLGATDFIPKPYRPEHLVELIDRLRRTEASGC